jgi:cytochrome c oxidase subunit 4
MDTKTHSEHVVPFKIYLAVGGALLVLTALTVAVSFVHLGGFNVVVALSIASLKALLVAFFFMHLWYDKKLNLFIYTIALLMLTFFLIFTMFDTMTRGAINVETRGTINPAAVIYEQPQTGPAHTE